jgi:uridine kinase
MTSRSVASGRFIHIRVFTIVLQVFVQCDSDLMLARRIKRDVAERGRSVEGVLDQFVFLPSSIVNKYPSLKPILIKVPAVRQAIIR